MVYAHSITTSILSSLMMETPENNNRHSLLSDSTNTTSYKPRKRPRSIMIVQADDSTRKRSCSKLEKFLILMLSLMLVVCLVLLCLYLNEKKVNEQFQLSSQTNNSLTNFSTGTLRAVHSNQSKYSLKSCWTKNCVHTSKGK